MPVKKKFKKSDKGKTPMTASDEVPQITKRSIFRGRACCHVATGTVGLKDGSGSGGSKQQHSPENRSVDVLEPRNVSPMMSGNDSTVVGKESCNSVHDDASNVHASADGGDTQVDVTQNTKPMSKNKRPRNRTVIISEEDQDKIREFLLANDSLYNKHRDQWRDTQSRERKWEELSELIGRDAKDIKQWYQSTRSKLSEIKNKKVTPSGSGFEVEGVTDKARRLWEHFQSLLPHIGAVKSRTVCSIKQKRAARLHVQLPDLDDEDQTNRVVPTQEAEEDVSAADASLERPNSTPPISASSDPATYTRPPPLVRDPKRAKVVDTAPDEGIQALVLCSQQLMVVGDTLARYLRPKSTALERQRQHRVRTFLDSCLRTCTWRHQTAFGLFCKMSSERPMHAVTLKLHPNLKLQLQADPCHTSNHSSSLIPHSGPATHLQPACGVPWGAIIFAKHTQVTSRDSHSHRNSQLPDKPCLRTFSQLAW